MTARIEKIEKALQTLSKPPITSLGPLDEGQPLKAYDAWDCLTEISLGIIQLLDQIPPFNNGDQASRIYFDGLWRWSSYLYAEYLRGSRLFRSAEDWRYMFFSVEVIFASSQPDTQSDTWRAWIENTPDLLRLLTDLWTLQITKGPERDELLGREPRYSHVHPIVVLVISRPRFFKQWCAVAGGHDAVAHILISRVDGGISKDDDLHALESQYAVRLLEVMSTTSKTCRDALLRKGGASRTAECLLESTRELYNGHENGLLVRLPFFATSTCMFMAISSTSMKQGLKAHAVSTAVNILLNNPQIHEEIQEDLIMMLEMVSTYLCHYTYFQIVYKDIACNCRPRHTLRTHHLNPKVREAIGMLYALLDYVQQQLNPLSPLPGVFQTLRRQICGFIGCQHSLKVPLSKISQSCFNTIYSSQISDIDPRTSSRVFSECSGCACITYCSKNCQQNDWTVHKRVCLAIAAYKREKKLAPPSILPDYDMKFFRVMTLCDMHRFKGVISAQRLDFLRLNSSTSPYLTLLVIDYVHRGAPHSGSCPPFTLEYQGLKDVLEDTEYGSEEEMAKVVHQIVVRGRQLYFVRFYPGDEGRPHTRLWDVPPDFGRVALY